MGDQRSQILGGRGDSLRDSYGTRTAMAFKTKVPARYKTRREAERALAEILEDGGQLTDFQIAENPDGSCVIIILERNGQVAGTLGV